MSENESGERVRPRRIENPEEELRRLPNSRDYDPGRSRTHKKSCGGWLRNRA